MNIIHLEASPGWGGQEIRILTESLGMRKRGHNVVLIVEKNGGLVSKAREKGFRVYEVKFEKKYWLITFFRLLHIFKKEPIDIINTHSSNDSWLGGIVARMLKIPIIRTRHLSTQIKKGLNSKLLYGKLADFVVTTCKKIVSTICVQANKAEENCFSIPTGMDLNKIKTSEDEIKAFRSKYNISEDDLLVGMACFMRSWKGIKDFLKAAYYLRDEKKIKWIIIGGGHSSTYIEFAKSLSLEDQVIFTGHLENPYNAIASLDIFLLLSTAHEGVSQASLQAAYLSKPLITTTTGGLGEVCIDKKTGINVPNYAPTKVAEAIIKLKESSDLRKQYGKEAKRLVEDNFTIEIMLNKMEEIYKKLFKKAKASQKEKRLI